MDKENQSQPEKKWKLFEGGGCPNCGNDLEVFSECLQENDGDGNPLVYDGEDIRCVACKFRSATNVDENGASVQDGNIDEISKEVSQPEKEQAEGESYPGKDYQRLFNAISDTRTIALQSEMDDIIQIVHEDFPASPPSSVKAGGVEDDPFILKHMKIIREKTRDAQIDLTIGRMGELEKSSIKYFLETGTINGSFRNRLIELMEKFAAQWNNPKYMPESLSGQSDEGKKENAVEMETMQAAIDRASLIMDEKDKEIERLKGLIGYGHQHGFSSAQSNSTIDKSWALFKTKNNL